MSEANAAPELEILLLGPPEIRRNGKPLEIKRRLLRTLLYYLACQSAPVGRGELIVLFWPETNEETARRNLRETLSKLRAQLPDPELIRTENDRVCLDWDRVRADVREYQGHLNQIGRILRVKSSAPFPESIFQTMLKAARLWRGSRFFAGGRLPQSLEYNNWFEEYSQQMELSRQHLLERLGEHFVNLGDNQTAILWFRKAVENDPLNQELHYQILDCLSVIGQRSEALAYCNYLNALFTREQVEPSFLLRKLCEKIHSNAEMPLPTRRPPWAVSLSLQVPFVGRERELDLLRRIYQRGGGVLLRAEPGGGKSRLAHETYQLLEPPPRVFIAVCRPMESAMPYQALVDMLRQFVTLQDWQQFDPSVYAPLFGLLPELERIHPENGLSRNLGEVSKVSIYEALYHVLDRLCAQQRLYWVFDDAQWSDEPSLGFLLYLLERNFFEGRGLLIISTRFEQSNDYLRAFLRDPHFREVLTQLDLPSLTEDEVTQIARYVLGSEPPEGLGAALLRAVGGNPLFILESLRAMLDSPQQPGEKILPLPVSLQKIYREKQRQLSPDTQAVLHAAAILGDPIRPEQLEAVTSLEPAQVTTALEELEQAGILKAGSEFLPGVIYGFCHEKIREAILRDLSAARRRLLHLRVAKALDSASGPVNPALTSVVAGHYEAAGEMLTAFRYWVKAGAYACSLYSFAEASLAYEHAENLLQYIEYQLTDQDFYDLYVPWALLAYDHAMLPQAYTLYLRLSQTGLRRNSPLLLGAGLSGTAFIHGDQGNFEHGLNNIKNAIPYLEQAGNVRELIEAHNRRNILLVRTMQYRQALTNAEALFQKYNQQKLDPQAQAALFHTQIELSLLRLYAGFPAEAVEFAALTLNALQQGGRMADAVWARVSLSYALFYNGQFKQALAHASVGCQAALTMKNWWLAAWFNVVRGRANLAMGNLDAAWKALEEALDICERSRIGELLPEVHCALGDLYRLLNMLDAAVGVYQAALDSGFPGKATLDARYRLGALLASRGEAERGFSLIEETITQARQAGLRLIELPANFTRGLLLFSSRKDERQGLEIMESAAAEANRCGLATINESLILVKAQQALQNGETEKARQLGARLLSAARSLPNPWIGVWACQLLSRALGQGEDPTENLTRIKEFLHILDDGCKEAALRPYWEALQTSIYQQLM